MSDCKLKIECPAFTLVIDQQECPQDAYRILISAVNALLQPPRVPLPIEPPAATTAAPPTEQRLYAEVSLRFTRNMRHLMRCSNDAIATGAPIALTATGEVGLLPQLDAPVDGFVIATFYGTEAQVQAWFRVRHARSGVEVKALASIILP